MLGPQTVCEPPDSLTIKHQVQNQNAKHRQQRFATLRTSEHPERNRAKPSHHDRHNESGSSETRDRNLSSRMKGGRPPPGDSEARYEKDQTTGHRSCLQSLPVSVGADCHDSSTRQHCERELSFHQVSRWGTEK